ncbi:hypothetical protein Gogos_021999, partial [Gossypium gossypioides]|nr:hypothetical protein [Gossypium gossypioides]
ISKLRNFTRISVTQNNLQELKEVDLVPIIEEYTTLLRYLRIQADKAYSRAANVLTFFKKLMSIMGMSKQWVTAWIKQKEIVNAYLVKVYGI